MRTARGYQATCCSHHTPTCDSLESPVYWRVLRLIATHITNSGAVCRDGCAHLAPQARAARRLRNLEENARLRWYSLPGRRRPTSLRRPARRVRRGSAPDPGIDRREWTRRLAACGLRRGRRSYAKREKVQRGLGCPQPQRLPPPYAPLTSRDWHPTVAEPLRLTRLPTRAS